MSRLFGTSHDDVLLMIMSWLDLRDHGLLDLALTNVTERKRWMMCLLSADLDYKGMDHYTHSSLRWLIQRKMRPESIDCSCSSVDDRLFVAIDNKLLHTLHLRNNIVTDTGLLMIAQGCPRLRNVGLHYNSMISDGGLLALATNLPGMTSIDLNYLWNVTSIGVFAIAERCPALRHISLQGNGRAADNTVLSFRSISAIASWCPKLQTINVSFSKKFSNQSLALLASSCKELRSFSLGECDLITDKAIATIANSCPELECLHIGTYKFNNEDGTLSYHNAISDESFKIVGQKCSKLVNFSIAYNNVSDVGIAALSRGCPKLQSFSANNCPSISTAGIMALTHGCKELRTINLSKCEGITDDCISSIASGCPELTSFTLSSSREVTNAGIVCMAGGCRKLKRVSLYDCRLIGNAALIAIASGCPNLLEISITACPYVSNGGILAIACGCLALESIFILSCTNVSDEGVIALALKCCNLQQISLARLKITDASLVAFAKNSRKLRRVFLEYCEHITSAGLSILTAKCAQIQLFYHHSCRKINKNENLLSLRRNYLRSNSELNRAAEHNHHKSAIAMLRYFISCK